MVEGGNGRNDAVSRRDSGQQRNARTSLAPPQIKRLEQTEGQSTLPDWQCPTDETDDSRMIVPVPYIYKGTERYTLNKLRIEKRPPVLALRDPSN